ncbi:hypothetical protein L1987_13763 [Smallanthus sonchifolius]|uniref:Uncharacterized protein n=1 Tax=Smallanthus sonchifolius TaxID=185202 RepID=A0ACB9JJH8_9ASTR|nr:hypothetical protein L1987_13763 [Smallanthus sonchifolius]
MGFDRDLIGKRGALGNAGLKPFQSFETYTRDFKLTSSVNYLQRQADLVGGNTNSQFTVASVIANNEHGLATHLDAKLRHRYFLRIDRFSKHFISKRGVLVKITSKYVKKPSTRMKPEIQKKKMVNLCLSRYAIEEKESSRGTRGKGKPVATILYLAVRERGEGNVSRCYLEITPCILRVYWYTERLRGNLSIRVLYHSWKYLRSDPTSGSSLSVFESFLSLLSCVFLFMHHTRLQGSPSFTAFSEPKRELHERTRDFRERLKAFCSNQVRSPSPIPFPTMGDTDPPARRTVHPRASDGVTGERSSITRPTISNTNSWQIPSHVMSTITHATQFHGLEDEDAPGHVSHFARICDTFNITGVSKDAIYLRLFPFSLSGRASTWLDTLPDNSITTWDDLEAKFFKKYYPPSRAVRLRDQIHSFRMDPDEPYHMALEWFNALLSRCP